MEVNVTLKMDSGAELVLVRSLMDVTGSMSLNDIGRLVHSLGSSLLPEIESKLVNQVSSQLDIGEKNEKERSR